MRKLRFGTALCTILGFLLPVSAWAIDDFDWTGAYIGVEAGTVNTDSTVDFSDIDSATLDGRGTLWGVSAGYNQQSGVVVYGVEADAATSNLNDQGDYTEGLDSLLTLRGRIGLTDGRILYYGTAGIGGGEANFSTFRDDGKDTPTAAMGSGFVTGPVMGAGVEYALTDNLTLKTEGLAYRFAELSGTGDTGKGTYDADYKPSGFVLRSGVNFHF
jgi:outer membrane immunogenic protein